MRENITWRTLADPQKLFDLLSRYKYLHFFATGTSGVLLNLLVTWALTRFVFGLERYFTAYLFGIAANLTYNFTLYTITIFKTERRHVSRFVVFIAYSLAMTYLQVSVVKFLTPIVGLEWYLFVIASTIMVFSTFNFFVFKLSIFKENFS